MPLDSEVNIWCQNLSKSGSWKGLFSIYCNGKKFDPLHYCVAVAPFDRMASRINWITLSEGRSDHVTVDNRTLHISFLGWHGTTALIKIPEYDRELIDIAAGHLFHLVRNAEGELEELLELRQLPQSAFTSHPNSLR